MRGIYSKCSSIVLRHKFDRVVISSCTTAVSRYRLTELHGACPTDSLSLGDKLSLLYGA